MLDKRQNAFFCQMLWQKKKVVLADHPTWNIKIFQNYERRLRLYIKSKQLSNQTDFPVGLQHAQTWRFLGVLHITDSTLLQNCIIRGVSPSILWFWGVPPPSLQLQTLLIWTRTPSAYVKWINMPNWSPRCEQARDLLIICHSENQRFVNTKWNSTVFY